MIIVFKSCEGYGIQSGGSVMMIKKASLTYEMLADVAYLIDHSGRIVCTVIENKFDYESDKNTDRRHLNYLNGFHFDWRTDIDTCIVTFSARYTAFIFANKVSSLFERFCAVTNRYSSALYYFFHYLFFSTSKNSENQTETDNIICYKSQFLLKEAQLHKRNLQSPLCTKDTLKDVFEWWAKLDDDTIKQIESTYRFSQALAMYRLFFLARKLEDVRRLMSQKTIFSKRQLEVIREYSKNDERFKDWKKNIGMSFSKPIELQYMS